MDFDSLMQGVFFWNFRSINFKLYVDNHEKYISF